MFLGGVCQKLLMGAALAAGIATSPMRADYPLVNPAQNGSLIGVLQANGVSNPQASQVNLNSILATGNQFTFSIQYDGGEYRSDLFVYPLSAVAGITDPYLYTVAAAQAGTVIFSDHVQNPPLTVSYNTVPGAAYGFGFVPNNTLAAFVANPTDFFDYSFVGDDGESETERAEHMRPLLLDSVFNPEGMAQFMSFTAPNSNPSLVGYFLGTDDQSRALDPPGGFPRLSDGDFNDIIFKVQGAANVVPEANPGLVATGTLILAAGATYLKRARRGR